MKIFEPQTSLKSVAYPVVKIVICLLLILLCISRNQLFNIELHWLNVLLSVLCFLVVLLSIFCICISAYEIFNFIEHRDNQCTNIDNAQPINIEEVIRIVNDNDIVQLKIVFHNSVLLIGSSSDCKNGSNVFFDKKYYIGDNEFNSLCEFQEHIQQYATNNSLSVISVDDIKLPH